ncbi:MAG: DUF4407 domain-containing protein [Bacteroidales bacterium]|nr:DUF4407 domain-containing protein [Bacteroidales bacterium]
MKNFWLKIACSLTGYDYTIMKNVSSASTKTVKKYLSALLIISITWGFIGFSFTKRYLQASDLVSSLVAFVMVIIVIQIERQIILTTGRKRGAYIFRIIIALVMAVIGSVIIDQVIFKEDIEKKKISDIQAAVNSTLTEKTLQLEAEIADIDRAILEKEKEYATLNEELSRKPMIVTYTTNTQTEHDSTGKEVSKNREVTRREIVNPKASMVQGIEKLLGELRAQKAKKEEIRMNIRASLEEDLMSKTGFLDELTVLFSILLSSPVAMVVWVLIFIFFLSMELFVIIAKIGDDDNDYDAVIKYQMNMRMRQIETWNRRPHEQSIMKN